MRVLFTFIISLFFTLQFFAQYTINFEGSGENKDTYASADISLSGISWNLTDVLTTTTEPNDFKNGTRSARFRGYSTLIMSMNADKADGLGTISFQYRRYGTDTQIEYAVEYSNDGGATYELIGMFTPSATVATFSVAVNVAGNIRVRIYANGGASNNRRMNIDDILMTNYIPAPVEFSKYTARTGEKSTFLTFATASETNNDFFTIERSADGRNFDAIGEIKGAGNSSEELTYEYIDDSPLQGINYYRIKQTDFDGQYSYTEIKSVRHRGTASVTISPRSTEGRLDITTAMEDYSMVVYNGGGQEVQRFDALSGDQSVSIDALQAGIYFIKVTNGSESETLRIVKF